MPNLQEKLIKNQPADVIAASTNSKPRINIFIFVGLGFVTVLFIFLMIFGVISLGIGLLIAIPCALALAILIILNGVGKQEVNIGKKPIIPAEEVEDMVKLFLITQKAIQPVELETTFPKIGNPPTEFALTFCRDGLDTQLMSLVVITNRSNGELSYIPNTKHLVKKDFLFEVYKIIQTLAEKPERQIKRGIRRVTPEGTVIENTEEVPDDHLTEEQIKKEKEEREKI